MEFVVFPRWASILKKLLKVLETNDILRQFFFSFFPKDKIDSRNNKRERADFEEEESNRRTSFVNFDIQNGWTLDNFVAI